MRLACAGVSSWWDREAQIILPSQLLASVAAHQFSIDQLEKGLHSWPRPNIQSMQAWLAARWQEARYAGDEIPTLLSPEQERLVWHQIIEQNHPHLFDIAATASLAQEAARTVCEWGVPIEGDLWSDHTDAQQFRHWYKQFRRRCLDEGWIARSDIWSLLPGWFHSGVCGRKVNVFAEFERVSPALENIRRALADLAIFEAALPLPRKQKIPAKDLANFEQEIEFAARWARTRYEQQPGRTIGVFVTDLQSRRASVDRIFQQVFYPSQTGDAPDSVFHNASFPLKDHPLIASALLIQELARPRIRVADAGAILRCPFISASAPERSVRALAEIDLRRKRELDVSVADLEKASKNSAELQKIWVRVRRVLRAAKPEQEFPAWSEFVGDLLAAVGWPGETLLTPREQQTVEMWNDALSGLATLGLVSGPVSFHIAISHLRRILSAAGPDRGDWSSPIQILNATDAQGLRFDEAILTGLSEENWPPLANVSPLVPLKLQRLHNVPDTSPQAAQYGHESRMRELFGVAPEIVATYSGRISPIAQEYVTRKSVNWVQWPGKLPRQSYEMAPLESMEDTDAPRYEGASPSGGTSLIKLQSLCPFRAFADRRLNAITPEEGSFGIDNLERGRYIHDVLKRIWDRLDTQSQLKQIAPEQLRLLIEDVITQVVTCDGGGPLHKHASQAERERLQDVITGWLQIERDRTQAFKIETTEEERIYEVAGLRLKLRIDRIDRLYNGKLVLIDYKSGEPSASHLDNDRPKEPQLLVYAASVGNDVDGLFFAQLKPRDLRLVGYSREAHTKDSKNRKSKVLNDWYGYLNGRRSKVENLAHEFAAGKAAVKPLKGACEYCQLKPLCRVNEEMHQEEDIE